MSWGLSGASGTGKTTLAKDVSIAMGITYHDASVTAIMQRIGFDPVGVSHDLDSRIKAQNHLLDAYCADIRAIKHYPFITDRTPLDMAAYMLGEVTMRNTTEAQGQAIHDYVQRCLKATEKLFDAFVLVPPLPSYEASATRPAPNKAYQLLIHHLIRALAEDDDLDCAWALLMKPDRDVRANSTVEFLRNRVLKWEALRHQCGAH